MSSIDMFQNLNYNLTCLDEPITGAALLTSQLHIAGKMPFTCGRKSPAGSSRQRAAHVKGILRIRRVG